MRIIDGRYSAGSRLPTRSKLMRDLDVSSITLQRAFDDLAQLGLITACGSQGTFVAERPPHLHRYALLFPNTPRQDGSWSRFFQALASEAKRFRKALNIDITCWYGINEYSGRSDRECLEVLTQRGLFRGLIFAYNPHVHGPGSHLVTCDILKAGIHSQPLTGIHTLHLDANSIIRHLLDALVIRAGRKIAIIGAASYLTRGCGGILDALRANGHELRPQWLLGVDPAHPDSAVAMVRMLFAPWNTDHPDTVYVTDDNLEDAVVAGLLAEGIKVGEDIQLLAHANFPFHRLSNYPATRIGYHAGAVLASGLDMIQFHPHPHAPIEARIACIPAYLESDLPVPVPNCAIVAP